jgi:group I intron endonuclease
MTSGIYAIVNTMNGKMYIGSASDLKARERFHFFSLRHGKHVNGHLQHAYDKYGESAFVFTVIEMCDKDRNILLLREQFYIDCALPENMYNICMIATRTVHSEDGKRRISEAMKGRMAHNKGTHLSESTRQKMSESRKGRKPTLGMTGRHHTQEAREKMSKAQVNKKTFHKVHV